MVVQSSCEAELLATNAGACEGMLLRNLLREMGLAHPVLQIFTDSSSNLATLTRRGPGRMRHLNCKQLWLQQQVREGTVVLNKVASAENVADILTKHLTPRVFQLGCQRLGLKDESDTEPDT